MTEPAKSGAGRVSIEITLPWPPSVNHYWRTTKGMAGQYVTAQGRAYQKEAQILARQAMRGSAALSGPLRVLFEAYPPDKRRRDLSNTLKATEDALQRAGVYTDDFLIADLRIVRMQPEKPGRIVARIELIDPLPDVGDPPF